MAKICTVWVVTERVLHTGVVKIENAKVCSGGTVFVPGHPDFTHAYHLGRTAFLTHDEAFAYAEGAQAGEIHRLTEELNRLKSMWTARKK